jgi:hypothetical protein
MGRFETRHFRPMSRYLSGRINAPATFLRPVWPVSFTRNGTPLHFRPCPAEDRASKKPTRCSARAMSPWPALSTIPPAARSHFGNARLNWPRPHGTKTIRANANSCSTRRAIWSPSRTRSTRRRQRFYEMINGMMPSCPGLPIGREEPRTCDTADSSNGVSRIL